MLLPRRKAAKQTAGRCQVLAAGAVADGPDARVLALLRAVNERKEPEEGVTGMPATLYSSNLVKKTRACRDMQSAENRQPAV